MVFSSGKASIAASMGCVAAAWRRCSVSDLLEVQAAVFRVSKSSGGKEGRGGRSGLRPSLDAPAGRVVNRVGEESRPPAGTARVGGVLVSGRMNGQCTAVAARQYATSRWRIPASSSTSRWSAVES